MSMFENPDNILLLQKLLQPHKNKDSSSESDDEIDQTPSRKLTPSKIGPKYEPKKKTKNPEQAPDPESKPKQDVDIEDWLKEQEKEDNDVLETRKRPEYTISYKQAVGTEDVFLQMGNKTSASSSCEDMVIDIRLPEETVSVHEMGISVTEKEIDLSTPVYRLKLALMHPINPNRSTAKYFTEERRLNLTCRMTREYDFVNF